MADHRRIVKDALRDALSGASAHVETRSIVAGLDWKRAGIRPRGAPHSVHELLFHMVYWQDWVLQWLDGANPEIPRHAAISWPAGPRAASRTEWDKEVQRFSQGLTALARHSRDTDLFAKRGARSRVGMLHTIASHNSYHAGQIVFVRQVLGAWPPASGGLTW